MFIFKLPLLCKCFPSNGNGSKWPCALNDVNSSLEVVRFQHVESDCFPAISGQIDAGIPSPLGLQGTVPIPG